MRACRVPRLRWRRIRRIGVSGAVGLTTRRIVGRFVLGPRYQGGSGMGHGGIIATLLDEAMGKVSRFRNVRAVTAELAVEYLKPVNVDKEIVVEAFEAEMKGRNLFHVGEIRDVDGNVLARGRGRFVILREKIDA
jgi:uncharacterized protein (TIGR00369 family)